MTTIREDWASFRSEVFDDQPEGELLEKIRTAFHGGATSVIAALKKSIVGDNVVELVADLEAEIEDFVEELARHGTAQESNGAAQ